MGLKDFRIIFSHPQAIYEPGQTVTGEVIVDVDSTKKTRGIKVQVLGVADTYWSDEIREMNNEKNEWESTTELYTGHEEYFKIEHFALGPISTDELELHPGSHSYPFNFHLPATLPSSFESDFGHIRYTVKAIIDRPWKFNHETKAAFSVISTLDLNKHESTKEPVHKEFSKHFCCLCCASGPLSMDVSLPVGGYVPGQSIPVALNVENHSGKAIETVQIVLEKRVTYRAVNPSTQEKRTSHKVAEVSKGPVGGNETVKYDQKLDVPSIPPSTLNSCGIINVDYVLLITARVATWYSSNLSKEFPIIIGTIPVSNYQMPQSIHAHMEYMDTDQLIKQTDGSIVYPTAPSPNAPLESQMGFVPSAPNLYPNLAPPSYEESVYKSSRGLRDRGESQHVIGGKDTFIPRYPVYNFSAFQ